ncbi:MAG: zincin-like metallopeptidase domain-containing protein [Sideroxydans sp.]|nr:zincin-like metallopeptidase domain-containing protein [Sideroxydans sp.]
MSGQDKIYDMVTDRILELMEQGTVPWRKTWSSGMPINFKSKKEYRGINLFFLNAMPYSCNLWGSFKQITEKGGKVNKGEHGFPVVFWKFLDVTDANNPSGLKRIPMLRYYTVFNLEQTDIKLEGKDERDNKPIPCAESIVSGYKNPPVISSGKSACYIPSKDVVQVPSIKSFDDPESYYSTLFHELIHSTGHKSRLNRFDGSSSEIFGSESYSKEELIAEMGASYLSGHCGFLSSVENNNASYLSSWMKRLKEDKKLLIQAAGKAQIAADHILGKEWKNEDNIN